MRGRSRDHGAESGSIQQSRTRMCLQINRLYGILSSQSGRKCEHMARKHRYKAGQTHTVVDRRISSALAGRSIAPAFSKYGYNTTNSTADPLSQAFRSTKHSRKAVTLVKISPGKSDE